MIFQNDVFFVPFNGFGEKKLIKAFELSELYIPLHRQRKRNG